MDNISLLEAHSVILSRHVDLLSATLTQGNAVSIDMATKQFIAELCKYLSVQEESFTSVIGDQSLLKDMRRDQRTILEFLDDIYSIHVTEPDGQFTRVMRRVIIAVQEKLEQDAFVMSRLRNDSLTATPDSEDKLAQAA